MQTRPFPAEPAGRAGRAGNSGLRRAARLAKMPAARRILGIDPGLLRTGYGVIDLGNADGAQTYGNVRFLTAAGTAHLVEAGLLTAKPTDAFERRLCDLHRGLAEILAEHRPDVMVIEDLFSTYAHPRSALLMAHARGVLMLAAAQAEVPVHSFLPNEIKQVVAGNGHATKASVQAAVKTRLRLAQAPDPPDVADALAAALCFAARQSQS